MNPLCFYMYTIGLLGTYIKSLSQLFFEAYSKVGDKNVQIRNLDTDEVFTYYQSDVGALPDAIIDIWGEDNIRELAGTPDGAPTDNANNVRYYHERFSDQTAPAR